MWSQRLSPCVTLSVLLSLWMDVISGRINIQLIPQYPVIGGSVTLNVMGVTGDVLSFSWFKGPNQNPEYLILTYTAGFTPPVSIGPLYSSRASPFSNASLLISDLRITDSGDYTVKTQTHTAGQGNVNLTVYERVSKPTVTASSSLPIENASFNLTCTTSNAERILWSRDRAGLPPGLTLSADNRTVTFPKLIPSHSGEYRCEAENKVSDSASDPYTVTVYYGPENIRITGESHVYAGSVISLTCSADSLPSPDYQWIFNGTEVAKHQTLRYDRASSDNTGIYTCVVNNTVTRRTLTNSTIVYVNITEANGLSSQGTTDRTGLIIGIVAAILVLATLISLLYLFIVCKRRKKLAEDKTSLQKLPSINGQANTAMPMEQPELQYADVTFSKHRPKKPEAQPELQYAEVNVNRKQQKKAQEQPELQYAEIDLSKHKPRKPQHPPEMVYENRRFPKQPENVIYSDLRR